MTYYPGGRPTKFGRPPRSHPLLLLLGLIALPFAVALIITTNALAWILRREELRCPDGLTERSR